VSFLLAVLLLAAPAGDDAAALYREGLRLFAAGQADAAIAAYRKSLAARPSDAATWKALGVAYAASGDYTRATEPFHRACLLDAKLPDACLYFGRALYLTDRFAQAVHVLRAAAAGDARDPQVRRVLGLALEASGDAAGAETAFREAIRLGGTSAPNEDPAIDYGVFLYRGGKAEEALDPLQAAVRRYPDAARARLELGCVLLSLDRLDEAALQLERAIALDPQGARGHLLLGKVYQRQGKTELARRELERAVK
jgi:tetratricopeptide (TPR) repeat protein